MRLWKHGRDAGDGVLNVNFSVSQEVWWVDAPGAGLHPRPSRSRSWSQAAGVAAGPTWCGEFADADKEGVASDNKPHEPGSLGISLSGKNPIGNDFTAGQHI